MAQTHKEIITTAISFKYVHFCTFNSSIMDEPMEDRQTSFRVLRLGSGSLGWDWDLEAKIWASRRGSGPPGKDLGLQAKIWASRL